MIRFALVVVVVVFAGRTARSKEADRVTVSIGAVGFSSSTTVGIGGSTSAVRIDSAWVTIRDVRLRAVGSCNRPLSTPTIEGPVTAELVKGRLIGMPSTLRLEAGRYCAFDLAFRTSRGRGSDAPAELRGMSIVVKGARADGVRFTIRGRLDTTPQLKATDRAGFSLDEPAHLLLGVDFARWFSGIELTTAETIGDAARKEIRIDERSNAELLAAFRKNVDAGLGLYRDLNGDGVLGGEERQNAIARAH